MNKVSILFFLVALAPLSPSSLSDDILIYEGKRKIQLDDQFQISKCNNISLARCSLCLDTPSYYFNNDTMQVISSCEGACWHPQDEQVRICKMLCPPPEWSCGKLMYSTPLHSSDEVIAEFFNQSKIDRADVNISRFEYDYIKGFWRIELQPAKGQCIDCYPSFYFKNEEKLVLHSVPHG